MAIFAGGMKDDGSASGTAETFIGPSVKLEGTFAGEGNVVVEGILVGTLNTKGDVRVGANAVIEAGVSAKNATIAGKIKGNIMVSDTLKLLATATVLGDIKTQLLNVEQGATINGKIQMGKEKSSREQNAGVAAQPADLQAFSGKK